MARLDILHYPDARLHTVAKPVKGVDGRIRKLVDDMAETMYAAPGIGLAATQVDVHERVIVIDVSETHNQLRVFINPEIVAQSGTEESEEGCLSVPGIFDKVTRAERVKVRALDREGKPFELEADGLLAVAIQHEYDHLHGVLMIDHLGPLKKRLLHRKMVRRDVSATA